MATMIDRIYQGDYRPPDFIGFVPPEYAEVWMALGAVAARRAPLMDPITVVAAGDLQDAVAKYMAYAATDELMAYRPGYRESWVEFDLGARLALDGFPDMKSWGFALRKFGRETVLENPDDLPAFFFADAMRGDLERAEFGVAMMLFMETEDGAIFGPICDIGGAFDGDGIVVAMGSACPPGVPTSRKVGPEECRLLMAGVFALDRLVELGYASTYEVVPPVRLNQKRASRGRKPILKSRRVIYAVPEPKGVMP